MILVLLWTILAAVEMVFRADPAYFMGALIMAYLSLIDHRMSS